MRRFKVRIWALFIYVGLTGLNFVCADYVYADDFGVENKKVLSSLEERVQKITLTNGLRILIVQRKNAPVFAGQVWVKVGGVNERPGITGAAHLLEHMAFKGTDKIGTTDYLREKSLLEELEQLMKRSKEAPGTVSTDQIQGVYAQLETLWVDNEFSRIYQRKGAVGLNAATAKDYTMYQIKLPNTALELWCWMESERLLNPVFRQFYKERDVVLEERRMRSDDSPQGRVYEALLSTAYQVHPYRMPVIGWKQDVQNLLTSDTAELHRRYYRPDNMVLSLVGDIDPEKARPLLELYFGRLEGKTSTDSDIPTEPKQTEPRYSQVEFDAQPFVTLSYHKPVYPNPDDLYFSILHTLISSGRSSILYKELVLERQLAIDISTSEAPGTLYPSLFYVFALPRQGVTSMQLADEVQKIFDRLAESGFNSQDFESARKRVKLSFLSGLDSNEDMAETLAETELLYGDWKSVMDMYEMVNTATQQDVTNLLSRYLIPSNRSIVELVPKSKVNP